MALLLGSAPALPQAATLRVPAKYPTIQAAINASKDGDEVLVSPGSYDENLAIGKAIALVGARGAAKTIVDGGYRTTVLSVGLTNAQSVRVSGFTFRNGDSNDAGAGVRVTNYGTGAFTLENCLITGNTSHYNGGGGVYLTNGMGRAVIRHSRVEDNAGFGAGGGIWVIGSGILIQDNVIDGNRNGGVSLWGLSAAVVGNVIAGNEGSGLDSRMDNPYVGDNLISRNTGGGVVIWAWSDQHAHQGKWINNTIADNTISGGLGTQVYVLNSARDALIANNAISTADGSVPFYCEDNDELRLVFENNDVYTTGGTAAEGTCAADALGGTDFSLPPAFGNGNNGHPYHLTPASPLIDAGSNAAAHRLRRDLGHRPRIIDGGHGLVVDVGAYEYQPD
jgi:hypothetical protein